MNDPIRSDVTIAIADVTGMHFPETADSLKAPGDEEEIVNEQEQNEVVNTEEEGQTTNGNG